MTEQGEWILKCPFCGKNCEKQNSHCGAIILNINEYSCGGCTKCSYFNLEEYNKHLQEIHNQIL